MLDRIMSQDDHSVVHKQDQSVKTPDNALSRRLNKILETRLEHDKDTIEALKELSTFFKDNTLQSRRSLRSKVEKRSLAINEDFLTAFRDMKRILDSAYSDVIAMNDSVTEMINRLQETKTQTYQLIDQTTKLQAESQKISLEQDVVKMFLQTYQLSLSEQAVLRNTHDSPVTADFFKALQRVQTLHSDCHILMRSGHQTAALQIMEQMATYQEAALEKLYRWTQSNCRNIESGETSLLLTQAMTCLQDRPILFKYVVDEYCTCRRSVLVRAFINALTQGGTGGTPKPIEMHADDPKRYVGDMLAWLHQTIPIEKDNLLTLLKGCDKTDVSEQILEALSNITEGVCHPLKVRVEHILGTETRPTILYGITNLVQFYLNIISQVVPGSLLETTLNDVLELSQRTFMLNLEEQVRQNLTEPLEPAGIDLSPAPCVFRLLNLLKDVLAVANVSEGREEALKKIVSCVVNPLLAALNENSSRLPSMDMSVYLLNCIHYTQMVLTLYEFMDERLERLQAQAEAQLDTVASEQASSLVANLNLGAIYTILQEPARGPLASIPGMEPDNLKRFLSKLERFLLMPDMLLLPQMRQLQYSTHRIIAQKRAFEVICAVYKQLYEAVHDPSNNYPAPEALMPRTSDDVSQSLDI